LEQLRYKSQIIGGFAAEMQSTPQLNREQMMLSSLQT
jgi:hypothetical protein